MKKKILIFTLLIFVTSTFFACASPNTAVEKQEDSTNNDSREVQQAEGTHTIDYKNLTLSIPHDWLTEKSQDDSMYTFHNSDASVWCTLEEVSIDEYVDSSTTKNDIYDFCIQFVSVDDAEDFEYEKGMFKDCPAVYYSLIAKDDQNISNEYKGVCFAADVDLYAFTVGFEPDGGNEEDRLVAEEIQNSIIINPDLNVGRYDDSFETQSEPQSVVTSENSSEELASVEDSYYEVVDTFSFNEQTDQPIYVIIVKNISNQALDFESEIIAYDSNGNAVGTGYDYEFSVASGAEACLYNWFDDTNNVDRYDYDITAYPGDEPVSECLDITINDTGNKVVISGTSKVDYDISGASVSAVFLKDGKYVSAADDGTLSNGDYIIEPGGTYATELDTYVSYDEVKVYVTGNTIIY